MALNGRRTVTSVLLIKAKKPHNQKIMRLNSTRGGTNIELFERRYSISFELYLKCLSTAFSVSTNIKLTSEESLIKAADHCHLRNVNHLNFY